MANKLSANEILSLLKLEPNATCGFVRLTFVSDHSIASGVLPPPFAEARPVGSALYFMVMPAAPVRLHRIRNDQLYHYYLGDPLEVFMLHADGGTERVIVGPDLRNGQHLQLLIPGNTFHTARLLTHGGRQYRMARSRTCRRRNRKSRSACRQISCRGRRSVRHRGVGTTLQSE
jgi:uncharacterized protein